MSDLWPKLPLEELVSKVGSGATPKGGNASYKTSGTPLIRSMNVVFFGFKREGLAFLDEVQAAGLSNVEVRTQDVLLNITGASIGRVTLAPADMDGARVNQHVCIIRTTEALDPRFLRAFLSSPEMQREINDEHYGVTRQALTKQQVLRFEIPLPPLNEQKRIADKLDRLLARVDAAKARLDKIPAILKRLRQSIVTSAVSGSLTEDWRVTSDCTKNTWRTKQLTDLCVRERVITYGVIKLGEDASNGVPCLRTSNVRWLSLELEGVKRIAPELSAEYSRTVLRSGDVLVNVRGTLGGVSIVCQEMVGWNVSREVAVVPVDSNVADPSFLAYVIASEKAQRWLGTVKKGVAYVGINIEDLRQLPVELPPMTEQKEIVRRVEELFAIAHRIEAQYQAARARVERLIQSLLAKAFRGELVPQDPNDEPAALLLERVRAQRTTAPAPKRGRRKQAAPDALPMVAEPPGTYRRRKKAV